MSVELESAKRLSALKSKADGVTGETSDTLADAVDTLIAGYGQGGGIDYLAMRVDNESDEPYDYYSEEVKWIGEKSFYYDNRIRRLSLPNCYYLGSKCCYQAQNLEEVDFPGVWRVSGGQHFQNTRLKDVKFTGFGKTPSYASSPGFTNCVTLEKLDFNYLVTVNASSYIGCGSFKALIIRRTDGIANLANVNAFNNCYHFHGTVDTTYNPDGLKDGYIYVPRALVETYQGATNWSTLATQFRALEDYTVDGTVTGELDANKV